MPASSIEIPAKQLGDTDHPDDGMTPAVATALDALDARVASIADAVASLEERTAMKKAADAADAERELWARTAAVEKSAGLPRHMAMSRVLDTDPALAARIENAPQPAVVEKAAEPVPVGAAGRQLEALAEKVAKDAGCTHAQAYAAVADRVPDLAEAADAEMWEASR